MGYQDKEGQLEVCEQVGAGLRKRTPGTDLPETTTPSTGQALTPEPQAHTFLSLFTWLVNLMGWYGMVQALSYHLGSFMRKCTLSYINAQWTPDTNKTEVNLLFT